MYVPKKSAPLPRDEPNKQQQRPNVNQGTSSTSMYKLLSGLSGQNQDEDAKEDT